MRRPIRERGEAWVTFQRALRGELNLWFSTIARYTGIVVVFYGLVIDRFHNPAIFMGGISLVFLKNVVAGKDE